MSALDKNSKFYYGWKITTANRFIDFNDGSIKLATLKVGTYTSQSLAIEIRKKMDAISLLDFNVTFDRANRKFTISTTSNFSLLFLTGSNAGQNCADLLGYTQTDKTGAMTYTSQNVSAYEYKTQFLIQSYKDTSTNRKAIDGTVNKSANGSVEVIKFGNERFMEADLNFITNIIQGDGSIVRTNITGREDVIQFLEWCTEKAPIEFMKNEDDVFTFQQFILESTPADSKGLDYDLTELYDKGMPYYYKTGILKFKLIS